ncbi:MAG: hypothetical protein OZSIB_1506 [Candidatus Ozemobacter sibiricus]|uniref:Prepilin-type N-terminal cleavage/methylation domain-containing protein n=1 Tax=Candidatus Ozemobacter sibiricus TaxID=2268124 RepID=A0A367ZJU7_9BACT|nr:MAG: hypothetical protein OZSIB_1506 [Candidatus Ozemobacter sibiricus]
MSAAASHRTPDQSRAAAFWYKRVALCAFSARAIDRRGFTFVELLIAAGLLTLIIGIVGQWFYSQRQYQDRITRLNDIQENLRQATFNIAKELKTGRQVIWPRINADLSPRSDTVLVFKNFRGAIVAYYHRPARQEIRRCVIPNGPGSPVEDAAPLGKGIASLTFTIMGPDNKTVSLHLTAEGLHHLDAVRLVNE